MIIIKLSYLFNILWRFNKKYKYIYGIYAYIFCKIDQCWNVFTNLIQKGSLYDTNYIFGDQGIDRKLIFYDFTELY